MSIDRRAFLGRGLALAGAAALVRALPDLAFGVTAAGAQTPPATAAPSATTRFGPLSASPDEHGLYLPPGFRSRIVAVGGEPVPGTDGSWHPYPDGAGVFPTPDGGWVYVSNSEVFYPHGGGAGALRFDAQGRVVDAYRILDGSTANCSGGAMPWGRWLSGEEFDQGIVWECDPFGIEPAVARPALGVFKHECAAGDPVRKVVYLSEDDPEGLLYRFRPERWADLGAGVLEAAAVDGAGRVSWVPVLDPQARSGRASDSAPGATRFIGGEGLALQGDVLYLCTKYDSYVRRFDLAASTVGLVYTGGGALWGADNLVIHPHSGELFICEDGGNMELVWVGTDGTMAPFMRWDGQEDSEVTGPAFDPSGMRLYVSSQRAPTPKTLGDVVPDAVDNRGLGRTYEITGPFWTAPTPTTQPRSRRSKRKKRRSSTTTTTR